jgi:hypothetical protein
MTQTQSKINTEFLQEWQPFDLLYKKVKGKILSHFLNNHYKFQSTNDERSKKQFRVYSFSQIDDILGLAYTSTSAYAGLWVCNAGYLWANDTHTFTGFAINTDGQVIGIADDKDENEIFIVL